jgi:hypothetical protein
LAAPSWWRPRGEEIGGAHDLVTTDEALDKEQSSVFDLVAGVAKEACRRR